jgi:guanine deaminase
MAGPRETILIHGGRVYDHDGDTDMPPIADVLLRNGVVADVAPGLKARHDAGALPGVQRVIDASGRLLLPGFFNAHYHSHDTLQKGCFETPTLDDWGSMAMPPAYGRRSKEELRIRTLVGLVECIRTGMSTVQDMCTLNPFDEDDMDVVLDVYEEVGLRCVFAPQFANLGRLKTRPYYDELVAPEDQWRLSASQRQFAQGADIAGLLEQAILARQDKREMISFAIAPNAPEGLTRDLWERVVDLSKRRNWPVYTHIYENKGMAHIARVAYADHCGSLVHYLHALGMAGPRLTLAHSVWMRDDEIALLAETGTHVALNPVGNLKTRSGVAPARAYLEAGVNAGIGCDNCSCSDVQNMFQAMKLYTVLGGICDPEEGPPFAAQAIRAATLGGARTAGRKDLGAIRQGMRADVTIIDLEDISYVPLNSVARQLVYTESGRGVESVIVDGRVLMLDRRLTTVDEAALRREVAKVMPQLLADLAEIKARLAPLAPQMAEAQRRSWAADIGVHRFVGPCRCQAAPGLACG